MLDSLCFTRLCGLSEPEVAGMKASNLALNGQVVFKDLPLKRSYQILSSKMVHKNVWYTIIYRYIYIYIFSQSNLYWWGVSKDPQDVGLLYVSSQPCHLQVWRCSKSWRINKPTWGLRIHGQGILGVRRIRFGYDVRNGLEKGTNYVRHSYYYQRVNPPTLRNCL